MSLLLNNINISKLDIEKYKYYIKYKINNINPDNSKIELKNVNNIKIINNDEIIYEYDMNPFVEDFENILSSLNEGEYKFNMDMYEDLVPLKYSVIKKNNNLFLYSVEHTIF